MEYYHVPCQETQPIEMFSLWAPPTTSIPAYEPCHLHEYWTQHSNKLNCIKAIQWNDDAWTIFLEEKTAHEWEENLRLLSADNDLSIGNE